MPAIDAVYRQNVMLRESSSIGSSSVVPTPSCQAFQPSLPINSELSYLHRSHVCPLIAPIRALSFLLVCVNTVLHSGACIVLPALHYALAKDALRGVATKDSWAREGPQVPS